jgi:PBP1b-binding outer membrane lipoprotein LpoB
MKQIAMLQIALLTALFFSGCVTTKYVYMKPARPYVEEANITQCRNHDMFDNQKCVLKNYINVKKERDILRFSLMQVTE